MPAPLADSQKKRPANLTLAPERLRFGQEYAQSQQTSLSKVVEDLLGALEQSLTTRTETVALDPLDGLLAGWPQPDKKELRAAQQQARLD